MPIIIVEGSIACGKTSLTRQLAVDLNALPLYEEVLEDGDKNGCPWLGDYYTHDNSGIAFKTQIWFLSSRFRSYAAMMKRPDLTCIGDRSLWGDLCFARTQLKLGKMTLQEFDTYEKLYNVMIDLLEPPKLMVFLNAEPEFLVERVKHRGRTIESTITLNYLKELGDSYQNFMHEYNYPHYIVDCDSIKGESCVATESWQYKKLLEKCAQACSTI